MRALRAQFKVERVPGRHILNNILYPPSFLRHAEHIGLQAGAGACYDSSMKLFFALLSLAGLACATDLAPLFVDGSAWEKTQQDWQAGPLNGNQFAPVDKLHIRLKTDGVHTFGTLDPAEMEIYWKEDGSGLRLLYIVVYNKGDDGDLDKKAFAAKLKETVAALDEAFGTKGKAKQLNKKDTGVKVKATEWQWENGTARLESCDQEFIRLGVAEDAEGLKVGGANAAVHKNSLRSNVRTDGTAKWIDGIPMVDQGQKGYCVPATLARVFGYYGMDGVDMHAMAALCESSGSTGTSTREMQQALEDISRRFHVRLTQIDGLHKDLSEIYAAYNKLAIGAGKPTLTEVKMGDNLDEADETLLMKALKIKPADITKWLKPVKKNVDEGIPLLWLVPGHMRMIIGYDPGKKEIIYSDSWGANAAKEHMSMTQAYVISMYRYVLKPSR